MVFDLLPAVDAPRLTAETIRQLQAHLRGDLLLRGDEGYEAARRVWNGGINRHPALIVRAAGAADVMAAIDVAGTYDLPLSIKGGGHGVAGHAIADGGLTIDLSSFKGIRVDPERMTVRVDGGVTAGELIKETQGFLLATPTGKLPGAGVAGTTLGAGIGWLAHKHGLSIDNLLSADVVTAVGRLLTASAEEHADLFWAIRGGGGNFGVVTSLEFRLHPVGVVYGGLVTYPLEKAREILRFFRAFAAEAPEELTMVGALLTGPTGAKMVGIAACYAGVAPEGERVLRALTEIAEPAMAMLGPIPYVKQISMLKESAPAGLNHRWRSGYVQMFSDELIGTVVDGFAAAPSPAAAILIEQVGGGAVSRVAADATAYPHRDAEFLLAFDAAWATEGEAEANLAWIDGLWTAAQLHLTAGTYVNFLDDEGQARVETAYGANYGRLRETKRRYDPTNLFRSNHNIEPAEYVSRRGSNGDFSP
ncbi:MAG: FAD-binding oxidoreductase [Thermomicrobiales bacterium]